MAAIGKEEPPRSKQRCNAHVRAALAAIGKEEPPRSKRSCNFRGRCNIDARAALAAMRTCMRSGKKPAHQRAPYVTPQR